MNTTHEEFKAQFLAKYEKKSIPILPKIKSDEDICFDGDCPLTCPRTTCCMHPHPAPDEATQREKFRQSSLEMQNTIKEWIASGMIRGLRDVVFDKPSQAQGYEIPMPPRKTLTQKEKDTGYIIRDGKLIKP